MPKDNRNLDKNKDEALIEEIINDDSPIPEDVDPADHGDSPDPEPETPVEEEAVVEEVEEVVEEVVVEEEPVEEDPDFEKKYSDSSREATALYFKNKKLTDTIEEASVLPEPTLDELKEYARSKKADYEELDEFSQSILKETLVNSKRFKMIHETTTANKDIDDWAKKVDEFSNSPEALAKYPSIADSETEFRKYCMKEQRRGMDMDDLTASFLFKRQGDSPAPKSKKKAILLSGGGGGDGVPKPKELTAEDSRIIRQKDPRRYERLVKEGKIGLDLLDRE